ncbi:uncharacterized protein B0H18DRAFT_957326 [Fomitopsis serialis]|uniref:uncharacterized protein n=1 Tax=Fomitopsis serialis TaxID=139415 RepID=UPI0020081ED8|nr:uncharacterized protein B0H18DRAFT_957326 [Neoantrodia serialis]KAH9919815.1 hypothetical protein B0H18DRAFT_957326 [Neoantrodia serialis]
MSASGASAPMRGSSFAKRPQSFPVRITGAVPQPIVVQGGSWSRASRGKRTCTTVKSLTEIPTWQLRHAQQQEGAVAGLQLPKHPEESLTRFTPTFEPKAQSSLPLPGRDIHGRTAVSSVLSYIHGKGHADNDNHPRRVPQPAMTKRQEGFMYTKNSDYVDGYKPTHTVKGEMTSTATVSLTSAKPSKLGRTSSILLTPSKETKRRKLDGNPEGSSNAASVQRSPTRDDASGSATAAPSPAEIWRWTLTREAMAQCFVQDVWDMKDSGLKEAEYFWLGRIPCRTVELLGVLVGIQAFEQRIVYTLDDGSAVIDCNHKMQPQMMSPRKTSTSDPRAGRTRQPSNSGTAYTSPRKGSRPSTSKPPSLPPPPKPVADIGTPVRLTGRVVHTSKGRQVLVDEIRPCSSPNDEPNHWIAVLELHRTRYFAEHLGPFVVPPLKKRAQPAWIPKSPEKAKGKARATDTSISPGKSVRMDTGAVEPHTPSSSGLASTDGSPVSSSSRHSLRQSPIRLRHPTRLHRRELTANTFRIYLKHYMDNAPPPSVLDSDSAASSRSASPTPHSRSQPTGALGLAMRKGPHTSRGQSSRPYSAPREPEDLSGNVLHGFTLSHLRRVSELMIMARRVVDEEGRRRAKEEREQARSGIAQAKGKRPARPSEPKAKKIKRLFQFAIRQLYEEGSIVLWDGPVRPLPREDTSATQLSGRSGKRTRAPRLRCARGIVERAITEFVAAAAARSKHRGRPRADDPTAPFAPPAPPPGPTPAEIVAWLHRDTRWARVGEWAVKDALEWARAEGRVWCIGHGRWELCG